MAAVRVRIFKINGIEYTGIIAASKVLGISLSTVLRKYKKSENFECNGSFVESYLVKPEIKKDTRTEKQCTECKKVLPNNTDYFRLDKAKVKLGHGVFFTSKCISCKKKYQSDNLKKKRLEAREIGTTLYAQMPQEKKEYQIERNLYYSKKNRDKINEKARVRTQNKTKGVVNANLKRSVKYKKDVEIMTDIYIAKLINKNYKELTTKELMQHPEYLDLHRANLKLKRVCKALKT